MQLAKASDTSVRSLHMLGVMCSLGASAWLGVAHTPTKLVQGGVSPFLISLCMVTGVFVARWTVPTAMKGTGYILVDLGEKPHLLIWGILAGALWAVANTLSIYSIRQVGLSIAFPLWNTNSLFGILWGWAFFHELRGTGLKGWVKVLGGTLAIASGATLLAYVSSDHFSPVHRSVTLGIVAALAASLMWGTMYIPYRKAYISGMNPLSFVTIFTVGELGTMGSIALIFEGGLTPLSREIAEARPVLFWLFLGGFCWVIGDLFQQYAAKYLGIGRGIPLSNTNQLWGLAWGALVFGELSGRGSHTRMLVLAGSLVMILGAIMISTAVTPETERQFWRAAMVRECCRYGLDLARAESAQVGEDSHRLQSADHRWWDGLIVAAAVGIFVWLGRGTARPPVPINIHWAIMLLAATLILLFVSGLLLWKMTRFS